MLAKPANVIVVVDLRTVEEDADAAKIEAFPQLLVVVYLFGLLAVDHEPLVKLLDQSREERDHLAGGVGRALLCLEVNEAAVLRHCRDASNVFAAWTFLWQVNAVRALPDGTAVVAGAEDRLVDLQHVPVLEHLYRQPFSKLNQLSLLFCLGLERRLAESVPLLAKCNLVGPVEQPEVVDRELDAEAVGNDCCSDSHRLRELPAERARLYGLVPDLVRKIGDSAGLVPADVVQGENALGLDQLQDSKHVGVPSLEPLRDGLDIRPAVLPNRQPCSLRLSGHEVEAQQSSDVERCRSGQHPDMFMSTGINQNNYSRELASSLPKRQMSSPMPNPPQKLVLEPPPMGRAAKW